MRDLLTFKLQELGKTGALSDQFESVRQQLLKFYLDYSQLRDNSHLVVGHMKHVVTACGLPVPLDLLNLLEEAEHAPNPTDVYELWQRDHLLHSLNLFCLGALMIARFEGISSQLDTCGIYEKLRIWAFCALFHDVGYIETSRSSIKDILITRFIERVKTVRFQLVCAFDYSSPLTSDLTPDYVNGRVDLIAITDPAKKILERDLAESACTPSPGVNTTARGGKYASYFASKNSDHGVSSAVILSLCKRISNAIRNGTDIFRQHKLPLPGADPWAGLARPLDAIALHDKGPERIEGDLEFPNPWFSFLCFMDTLCEYDRRGLRPDSTRQILPIEHIRLDDFDGRPILHLPLAEDSLSKVQRVAEPFSIMIRRYN
jgi:hypothetical protein